MEKKELQAKIAEAETKLQAKIAELETKLGSQARRENQTSSSQSSITSKPTEKRGALPKGW